MSEFDLVPVEGELMPATHKPVEGFNLESGLPKGEIPQRVVDELVHVRTIAKDYAQSYSDAVKAQAEKHGIPVGALKRYVAALADDKVEDARNETDALEKLLLVKSVDPIDG